MTSDIVKRQRTVPVAKVHELNWQRPVPDRLLNGAYFDRFDEVCGPLCLRYPHSSHRHSLIRATRPHFLFHLSFFLSSMFRVHTSDFWIRLSSRECVLRQAERCLLTASDIKSHLSLQWPRLHCTIMRFTTIFHLLDDRTVYISINFIF